MPIKLPHPRSVLAAMVAFSCAVLALHYTWDGDGPSASEISSARSQLLADVFVDDAAAPPLCRAQQEQLLRMLRSAPAPASADGRGCEIQMLVTLRQVLDEAEADFAANRLGIAFSKARAVIAHNQAVLRYRSLLTVSVSGARATEAMALMQQIAARSREPELRAQWRRQVDALRRVQLEDEQIALAIVVGEGRAYLLADEPGALTHGISQSVVDELTVAYAGLQRNMKYGSRFLPECLEQIRHAPACTFMQRAGFEQRALRVNLDLVAKMLAPRA